MCWCCCMSAPCLPWCSAPLCESTAGLRIGRWRPFKGSAVFFLLLVVAAASPPSASWRCRRSSAILQEFAQEMPARLPALMDKLKQLPFAQNLDTADPSSRLQDFAQPGGHLPAALISDWAGRLFDVVMGFILTIYFILEGDHAYALVSFLLPAASAANGSTRPCAGQDSHGQVAARSGQPDAHPGRGQHHRLSSFHVRYAYALGVLTGVLNIIPVLGAAISIVLALLVAAIDSWGRRPRRLPSFS